MMPVSFRIKLKDAENYKLVAEQFEGHSGVESRGSTSVPPWSPSSS